MINISLAVLGGAFGFALPEHIRKVFAYLLGRGCLCRIWRSPYPDVSINMLVLFCQGIALFLLGNMALQAPHRPLKYVLRITNQYRITR